jgi:kinesin family protein 2/24
VDATTSPFELATVHGPKVVLHEATVKVTGEPIVKNTEFIFDAAFNVSDDSEAVYQAAGREMVDWTIEGGVGTILAYGQTGSGKTFTMSHIMASMGRDLFGVGMEKGESEDAPARKVKLAVFEIMGNNVACLLSSEGSKSAVPVAAVQSVASSTVAPKAGAYKNFKTPTASLRELNLKAGGPQILEDAFGHVQVHNVTVLEPSSEEEFSSLVNQAFANRTSATTKMNESGSSRSHAVCKVTVEDLANPGSEPGILYLVDLAGSERHVDKAGHSADRLNETKAINSSLMVLKDCIRSRALRSAATLASESKKIHVPFRNTKITLLLKDMLDPEARRPSKCVVIACCSPVDTQHSLNTLRYIGPLRVGLKANGATTTAAAYDPRDPATWNNEQLREWITQTGGAISADSVAPNGETGMQLLRQTQNSVVARIMTAHPEIGKKRAEAFYVKLWKLMVDARSDRRKGAAPGYVPKQKAAASDDEGESMADKAAKEAIEIRRKFEEKRKARELAEQQQLEQTQ